MNGRLLYAAIFADERNRARFARHSFDIVVEGRIAAVTGLPLRGPTHLTARALAHDTVMELLLEHCSAVMPFRLDTRAPFEPQLHRLLHEYEAVIAANLVHVQNRVEMGIKAKSKNGQPFAGRLHIERIHQLAGATQNRRERIVVLDGNVMFEGTYLIPRDAMDEYWSAVLDVRNALPGFAVIGTGPWAPYSFCDVELPSNDVNGQRRSA